jgi:hypothetical protein
MQILIGRIRLTKNHSKVNLDKILGGPWVLGTIYKMNVKRVATFGQMLFLILSIAATSHALVNTTQVDEVLKKAVLDGKDLKIIDEFLADAVQDMVRTIDFTSIAKTRAIILNRQNTQAQYMQQFSESAYKHISEGLQQAASLPEERRFKVITNLLILIESLKDPRLIELPVKMLDYKNQAVRYWAVRAATNRGVVEQLGKAGSASAQLINQIITRLSVSAETSSPEVLMLIADFTAKLDSPQADELLSKVADVRIRSYADWTVKYELIDAAILRTLWDKAISANPGKPDVARRFAQLYSYVILRYINGRDLLGDTAKQQLASVIVDTEVNCLSKLEGGQFQSTIRRSVEGGNPAELQKEHDRLFGVATAPGDLVTRLKFNYGQNPDGSSRASPLPLPAPPRSPQPK